MSIWFRWPSEVTIFRLAISRTLRCRIFRENVWARIANFHKNIHTGLSNTPSVHDVINYIRSEFMAKERRKWRLRELQVELLKKYLYLSEDHKILWVCRGKLTPQTCRIWHRKLLPVDWKMQLNTAEKWCVKRVRPAKESNSSATVQPRINKFCMDIQADLVCSQTGYEISRYFRSAFIEVGKTTENAAFVGIGWNFFRTIWARITKFYTLVGTISPTNLPDMTSLSISGWLKNVLNTAQKCAKRVPPDKESNISTTV